MRIFELVVRKPVPTEAGILIAGKFLYMGMHHKCKNGKYKPVLRYIHRGSK